MSSVYICDLCGSTIGEKRPSTVPEFKDDQFHITVVFKKLMRGGEIVPTNHSFIDKSGYDICQECIDRVVEKLVLRPKQKPKQT